MTPRTATETAVLLVLAVAGLTACGGGRYAEIQVAPAAQTSFLDGKPAPLHAHYATLLKQGPRNLVLNHARAGLAALELGAHRVAAESLDQALLGIEAVYAQHDAAARARALWYRESYKDWKGEPYERAMAFYYRGLLYLREGDYENARASFKGGVLQDAFAEEEQFRSDFALLMFLEGWASRCLGDEEAARQNFAEVARLEPALVPPAPGHDLLVVAETGTAPVKYRDGPNRAQLRFARGAGFGETRARASVGAEPLPLYPIEDIFWQAATRGGRPVDAILAGKVEFKETAKLAGGALLSVGLSTVGAGAASQSKEAVIAGGIMTLAGLAAHGVSAGVKPEADARYWDNLPDMVHVGTARHAGPASTVRVRFADDADRPVGLPEVTGPVHVAGRCGLTWVRSRSAVPRHIAAPFTGEDHAGADPPPPTADQLARSARVKPGRRVIDASEALAHALAGRSAEVKAFQVSTGGPPPAGPQAAWKEEEALRWALANRGPDEAVSWFDPASGTFGQIVVTRLFTGGDAQACKAYRGWRVRDGKRAAYEGTGCRAGGGDWRAID
jgi:surface antigen/tetratricopeptide (TPR) repeat protein